jgi:hypothetical protein
MAKDLQLDLYTKNRAANSTQGELFIDGVFECYTLEDKDRKLDGSMHPEEIKAKKIAAETCIPRNATHEVVLVMSPKHGRLIPQLLGVKGFKSIQIHIGNFISDTLGCILVGQRAVLNAKTKEWELSSSTKAFDALYKKISDCIAADGRVFITIHS